jgi:hypothetical protein
LFEEKNKKNIFGTLSTAIAFNAKRRSSREFRQTQAWHALVVIDFWQRLFTLKNRHDLAKRRLELQSLTPKIDLITTEVGNSAKDSDFFTCVGARQGNPRILTLEA